MGQKLYQKTVSCMFCGRSHAISAHTERELRQLEFMYRICVDCQSDSEKLEKWKNTKEGG